LRLALPHNIMDNI